MSDTTINRPDFESINVKSKTVAFACLELDVAELVGSIRWDAASVLNWRPKSAWFAHQVLMRMGGEFAPIEMRGADFSRALWPDQSSDDGKKNVSKLIARLKEDQIASGFEMIGVNTERRERRADGSYFRLPTLYMPGDFPALFKAVQDAALECDLCRLPLRQRRARQRSIVESWLFARGCKRIPPRVRQSKKPATVSEAAGAPETRKGKVTKEDVEKRMSDLFESLFECGQDWMSCGLSLGAFAVGIHRACDQTEIRLRDAVVRSNKPGLKLVGGQK